MKPAVGQVLFDSYSVMVYCVVELSLITYSCLVLNSRENSQFVVGRTYRWSNTSCENDEVIA